MQPNALLPILSQFKQVEGLEKLYKLRPSCLKWPPKSDTTSSPEEVRQKVAEFAPEQGWLCFQSKVDYFREPAKMSFSGILLYGEVVKKATNQSLHIREEGQNGWILTYFEETEGDNYLVENTVLLGEKELAPNKLGYRVYWQHDEKQGYRQLAARFNGFSDT